jgi:hypothetical protein
MNNKNILLIVFLLMLSIGLFSGSIMAIKNYDLQEVARGNEMNLILDIGGAEIFFNPDEENIYISEGLKVERRGDSIYISSPKKDKFFGWFRDDEYYLIIGTAREYDLLDIAAGGIDITGKIVADEIDIKAGGINIEADIYSRKIDINGAGINLDGYIKGEKLHINGAGMSLSVDVEGLEDIGINGAGIRANIKYLDGWTGIRYISINGAGGDLDVHVPSENNLNADGKLDIDTTGLFDTDVHYY